MNFTPRQFFKCSATLYLKLEGRGRNKVSLQTTLVDTNMTSTASCTAHFNALCYHVCQYHLSRTGCQKAEGKAQTWPSAHSKSAQKGPMWTGTSLHRDHSSELWASPQWRGQARRNRRVTTILVQEKYHQPFCVHSMNKQKLVSGRSTELHQCGFERVPSFLLCTQFRQLSHLSVCVLTPTSVFAGKVLLRARIQKYCSQVREGWSGCLNYETGCPDRLFLFCRGLALLWSSLIIFVLLMFFFPCTVSFKHMCRFGFHWSWWRDNCRW